MMYEIVNRGKAPVQVILKSKNGPREFTVKNIPGVGKGQNIYRFDEKLYTEYVDRLKNAKIIDVKKINTK